MRVSKQTIAALKVLLTLALLGAILHRVGIGRFIAAFASIDVRLFLAALLFFPLVAIIGAEKWRRIIGHEATGIRFGEALVSFLGGMSLGLLTPGRVGEIGRVLFLSRGRKGALAGIAIVDKLVDLEVTLALGLVGVHLFWGAGPAFLLLCAVLASLAFLFRPGPVIGVVQRKLHRLPLRDKIDSVLQGITGIPRSALVSCLVLRLAASAVDIFQFFLLINSFASIGLREVVAVYPLIIMTNILPLTIGGIGVREGVSLLTLAWFGTPAAAAVNSSFLLFCINTLLPGLLGSLFISRIQARPETGPIG